MPLGLSWFFEGGGALGGADWKSGIAGMQGDLKSGARANVRKVGGQMLHRVSAAHYGFLS